MSGWQPIETAPKDGSEVLIYYPEWGNESDVVFAAEYDQGRYEAEGTWYAFHYGHTGDGATHWMPLPEPPQ